jgi:hypothetical protein
MSNEDIDIYGMDDANAFGTEVSPSTSHLQIKQALKSAVEWRRICH